MTSRSDKSSKDFLTDQPIKSENVRESIPQSIDDAKLHLTKRNIKTPPQNGITTDSSQM